MSEEKEKEPGFFAQIKTQLIAGIGIIITTAGGLVVTNMEALFSPPAPVEEVIDLSEPTTALEPVALVSPLAEEPISPTKEDAGDTPIR